MSLHIIFFFLYVVLSVTVPAETMCFVLIFNAALNLFMDWRKKKPLYLMTVFYIGIMIITTSNYLYIHKINTEGLTEFSMYRYIIVKNIDGGISLWCLGTVCIFIGYEIFSKSSFPPVSFDIRNPKTIKNIYKTILVLSFLNLTGNAINLGFITGGLTKVMALLNVMGIMFFSRMWVYENNKLYRNYAISLIILQTIVVLFTSFLRFDLLAPSLSFFGGYFIEKKDIKAFFGPMMIPLVVIGLVFSSFFNILGGNRAHFIDAFTIGNATEETSVRDASEDEDKGQGGALERSANIAQLTNIIDLVDKNGYYGGTASAPLVAAFIPRILWPDKPTVQLGAWFAVAIGGAIISENGLANNSINMSVPGELYLDFGWIGLIVGCILFGGLAAAFWNASQFNSSPYNLSGTLWGGYLLLYALSGIGGDLQIIVSLTSTYIIFLLLKRFAK